MNKFLVYFVVSLLWYALNTHSTFAVDLSSWTLDDKLGQLFMVGFHSQAQIEKIKPGGVILFSWNMKDIEGTRHLTQNLKVSAHSSFKAPLFIAIDHEGGQVLRLRRGMTAFPDAAALGATRDPYLAFRVGKAMGAELCALGINMNLAPVLDLGNARSFLQNRVWGDHGRPVAQMTTAFIRGLQAARIFPVAKHFPGHGRSSIDAHFGLPNLNVSESQLWAEDLEPFKEATLEGVQAVMTAHVKIPSIDTAPASLSHKFITEILRNKIGFQGLVVTDDLEMGGVKDWGSPGDVALKALKAGSDMILLVWSVHAQNEVFDRLKRAVLSGEFPEALLDNKVRRILAIKDEVLPRELSDEENPFWRENLRRRESLELAELISQKAVAWLAGDFDGIMKSLGDKWSLPWQILLPTEALKQEWLSFRPEDKIQVLPRRPDDQQLSEFGQRLKAALETPEPLLVVTGPRAASSEDVFQIIRKQLSQRQRLTGTRSAVIWAHQGSQPVDLKQRDPASLKIGLISLYTSSKRGISAFVNLIKEGTSRHGYQLR